MIMDTILYGFDARTSLSGTDPNWSDLRRARYLLRPEISRPLSVDPQVWPKAFSVEFNEGFARDYWTDLAELRRISRKQDVDKDDFALVALAVRGDKDQVYTLFMPPTPSELDANWQTLGWDVADSGLISALSNCGYRSEEVDTLRQIFAPKLNDHGLFDDVEAAETFCVRSEARVPEHPPFFVHQLFCLASAD